MNHKSLVEWRTAAMGAHDCHHWEAWKHLPFELWPDAALASYLDGTGSEGAFNGGQPTAAELRAIVADAIGACEVIPTPKDQAP